jgi:hypothetical protein
MKKYRGVFYKVEKNNSGRVRWGVQLFNEWVFSSWGYPGYSEREAESDAKQYIDAHLD